MLETATEFVVHGFSFPNYLAELGPKAQSEIYSKSSTDLALRDAFRKMRRFLMSTQHLSEDEAVSLMSIAVDFGITQVVDGNWGIHAIVRKSLFAGAEQPVVKVGPSRNGRSRPGCKARGGRILRVFNRRATQQTGWLRPFRRRETFTTGC